MKNNSLLAAKTFLKMADYDRKILIFINAVRGILTVSVIIKLFITVCCLLTGKSK